MCVSSDHLHLRWHRTYMVDLWLTLYLAEHPPATSARAPHCPTLAPFYQTARSMRAFMSTAPCHGLRYEFISQARIQGMFNLALRSNHFTEVEVMVKCLCTAQVCGLDMCLCLPRYLICILLEEFAHLKTCGQSCY